MNNSFEAIFCIVNAGFSDAVMDTARLFGARGGTVLRAHGTAVPEVEDKFGISISPEKEVVITVVPAPLRDDILHALYKEVGLATAGQGIAFSLPVDEAVGLTVEEKKETK